MEARARAQVMRSTMAQGSAELATASCQAPERLETPASAHHMITLDSQRLRMGEPVHVIAPTLSQAPVCSPARLTGAFAHLVRYVTFRASQDLDRPGRSAYPIAPGSCQGPVWMEMERPAFAQMADPAETSATGS